MTPPDVLIIGAGLAGLHCARLLQRDGLSCHLIEAAEAPGGRIRTDRVEGFLLDRGFQVLLTAYPEARAAFDYGKLGLQPFYDGVLVRYGGRFHRLANPFRRPAAALDTLTAPLGTVADKLRVARLRRTVTRLPLDRLLAREETTTAEALRRRYGFSEAMVDRFFRPFFGGIFLDRDLQASSRLFDFLFRMFAEGPAALPAEGMEALPRQLAARLAPGTVQYGLRAAAVTPEGVVLDDGTTRAARAVVVATEAPEAARLLGMPLAPTAARQTACLYYAATTPPLAEPVLVLNGDGEGLVNNLCVLSNVAPSYAPPGQALVSATIVGLPLATDDTLDTAVRVQLAEWFGAAVQGWRLLRLYRIPYALPEQAPPFLTPPARPARLAPGRYVCGDHRHTASINGALASGRLAARTVADDLRAP